MKNTHFLLIVVLVFLLAGQSVFAGNTVNVRDFGAKGDGLTDDSTAIQKAIDSVSAGGTVTIPAGIYMLGTSAGGAGGYPLPPLGPGGLIQSAIMIKNNNGLKLVGTGSPVLKLMAHKKIRIISVENSKNVVLDGLIVDGNKSERNGAVPWPDGDVVDGLIWFDSNATFGTIKNVEARNGIEDGMGFWRGEGGLVENCYSHDNGTPQAGAGGISLSGGSNAKAINNRTEKNSVGISALFGSHNVEIRNNIVIDNRNSGITVGGYGIWGGGSKEFIISGNTIKGNSTDTLTRKTNWAAITIAGANNGHIDNNKITNNYSVGIQINGQTGQESTNWIVENNTCLNSLNQKTVTNNIQITKFTRNITLQKNQCLDNLSLPAKQISTTQKPSVITSPISSPSLSTTSSSSPSQKPFNLFSYLIDLIRRLLAI